MDRQRSSPLIRQLLRSMKKLKSLMHSWRMHSSVSRSLKKRWFRLFSKQMGMQRFLEDEEITDEDHTVQYKRTISCVWEDDIDKRAEAFIANFRRQLCLERIVYYSQPKCYISGHSL
ncbi:hypothetical protein GLYMA_06G076800v4 [Glycine max]|uniref:Uncharacterized protein n=1 Tax=Glycine max TaxID=3847 RepID=A0A0R0JIN0_SOYBN|nr:hypothetical protein JHK87_014569 [Glycine soja]KAH1124683.1 hypothetical protein GYH30_014388 [Glycine max]KRH52600.1 hypothetical protein GLYMA_06G076800v4 [Glycine max]